MVKLALFPYIVLLMLLFITGTYNLVKNTNLENTSSVNNNLKSKILGISGDVNKNVIAKINKNDENEQNEDNENKIPQIESTITPQVSVEPKNNNKISQSSLSKPPTATLMPTLRPTPTYKPTNTPISTPTQAPLNGFRIILGNVESVPMMNLKYVPDGHISKIENGGKIKLFVTAHDRTYIMQGNSAANLTLLTDVNNSPLAILKPEGTGFEKDYAGFGSVFLNKATGEYMGIYHAEQRVSPDASDTQVSTIAVAISRDEGLTWEKKNKIITGLNELPVGTKGSGAGQPSAIIVNDYIYLYYFDLNYKMQNSVHLARAALSSNGMPGSWEKHTKNGFTSPGLGGYSDPVISSSNIPGSVYVSNPSISYNSYLKKYFAVVETNLGFYAGVSDDGINWGNFKQFYRFPKDTNLPKSVGEIWYSYPNFISFDSQSDTETSQNGYLYYSRGIFGQTHYMVRRSFIINSY